MISFMHLNSLVGSINLTIRQVPKIEVTIKIYDVFIAQFDFGRSNSLNCTLVFSFNRLTGAIY